MLIKDNTSDQSASSTIEVEEDIRIDSLWVAVSITHTYRGDLRVELNPPGGGAPLVLHATSDSSEHDVRRVYTAQEFPLVRLIRTQAQGEWTLTAGDYDVSDFGTLDAWGIGFGTQMRVVAGASTMLIARLVGVDTPLGTPMLSGGETVEVGAFEYAGMGVMAAPFSFTQESREVDLTLTASADASAGALFAVVNVSGSALVEPLFVALTVDIDPRVFVLSFAAPAGDALNEVRVLAGGERTVTLSLTGALLVAGETLTVALAYADATDGTGAGMSTPTTVTPTTVEFSASSTEVPVTLAARVDAPTPGILTAMIGSDAANAVAEPAMLAVVIVPREFALSFVTPAGEALDEARVAAGGSAEVVVRVEGMETLAVASLVAGEMLTVALAYAGGTGVGVVPDTVEFSADSTEMSVTLTATVNATSGTLTAMASAAPVNADVAPASLPVAIASREFALSFTTPGDKTLPDAALVRVLAGGATEVTVVLDNAGALLADESVRVSLIADTVTIEMPVLTLTAQAPSATLTIDAVYNATPPSGMVEASGAVLSGGAGVVNTRVASAILSVDIVARQFRIELDVAGAAYTRSPGVAIRDGTGTQSVHSTISVVDDVRIDSFWVAVSITHSLPGDLVVELTPPGGGTPLRLHDRTASGGIEDLRRVYTSRDVPLDSLVGENARGEWVLTVGDYLDDDAGTLNRWGIGFGTPAQVLAGISTVFTVRLVEVETALGSPTLFTGEVVPVSELAYDGAGVMVAPFMFTMENTQVDATLTVLADAASGALFVGASAPVNAVVEPTTWPVEVVARQFRIELNVAGDKYTRRPGLEIPDGTPMQSVRSMITVMEGVPTESFWVAVSITHPFPGDLVVELTPPGAGRLPLKLHDRTVTDDLRRVYTSRDDPLDSLVGENAQGAWVLTVGDYQKNRIGTLDAWGIGFGALLRVVAGASTALEMRLVGVDTGLGSPMLLSGETVETDMFAYSGVGIDTGFLGTFTFRAVGEEFGRLVPASVDATSGALFATMNVPEGVVVEPPFVALGMDIEPREFALSFVADEARVKAGGSSVALQVRLSGVASSPELPPLGAHETLTVALVYIDGTGVGVVPPTVEFSAGDTEADLTLTAMVGATQGMLTAAIVSEVMNAEVASASLPVRVVREFALSFATSEDEVLNEAWVLAGGSTAVRVVLGDFEELLEGEEVRVTLVPSSVTTVPGSSLTEQAPGTTITIDAAYNATPPLGTVMASGAVYSGGDVVVDTVVLPATLPVAIVARQFRIELDGAEVLYTRSSGVVIPDNTATQSLRSTIAVVEDLTIESVWVFVSITHPFRGDLIVELNPPGGSMPLRLHDGVAFRAMGGIGDVRVLYTAREPPLDSLLGTDAQGEWVLTVGDYRDDIVGTLDMWSIGFGPLRVLLAGASTVVTARLVAVDTGLGTPMLSPGEIVAVDMFAYSDGRRGVGMEPFTFTADETQVEVTLTASAAASAGLLSAATPTVLPVNTMVEPVVLAVEIEPRRFRIELDVASDSYTRVFSPGLMIEDGAGESVSSAINVDKDITIDSVWVFVSIAHPIREDLIVELNSPRGSLPLRLHDRAESSRDLRRAYTSREFPLDSLLGTDAQGEWVLTVGDYNDDDDDFGSLDAWGIGFNTQARVVAGALTVVTMRLVAIDTPWGTSMLSPDEAVKVGAFEYSGVGVEVAPPRLTFTARTTQVGVTLTASVDAMPGLLFAVASRLVNVVVESPFVALDVGIEPREFSLVFAPAEIGVLTGDEVMVSLSLVDLTGASLVPGDPAVTVELTLSHPDELTLVTPATLAFDASTMIHTVTLSAAEDAEALEGATLSASVIAGHSVPNAMFASGSLLVNVIDRRDFIWVFRSAETDEALSKAVVVAGATTRLRVSLEDDQGARLLAGERVEAALTAPAGLTVSPSSLMLSADMMSREVVLNAGGGGLRGELSLDVTQPAPMDELLRATLQRQAALPVRVVREFALSFTTLEDELLDTARVLAGGLTEVQVVLDNPDALLAGERVRVVLFPTVHVVLDDHFLMLTVLEPSTTFAISVAHDVTPFFGTVAEVGSVSVAGTVFSSVGDRVLNTRVLSTHLSVEIVERQFRLRVVDEATGSPISIARVLVGGLASLQVRVEGMEPSPGLGVSSLGEGETLIVDFAYMNGTGVRLSPAPVRLGADNPMPYRGDTEQSSATVVAFSREATNGVLELTGGGLVNAVVEPVSLPVETVVRRFEIELDVTGDSDTRSFSPGLLIEDNTGTQSVHSTITVADGIPIDSLWVAVSITHPRAGDLLIELTPPGEDAPPLLLYDGMGEGVKDLRRAYTSRDMPLSSLVETNAQSEGEWVLTVGDYQMGAEGALDEWGIGFGTQARVLAGILTVFTGHLVGVDTGLGVPTLFPGELVSVGEFAYSGAGVLVELSVSNLIGSPPTGLDFLVGVAASMDATSGVLFGVVDMLVNMVIEPSFVALDVGVEPREFALSFATQAGDVLDRGQVLAGGSIEVVVRVEKVETLGVPSLGETETLAVELTYTGGGTGVEVAPRVAFSANSTEVSVTLTAAVGATPGMLTAAFDGALVNVAVADGSLPVDIVPREFALSFATPQSDAPEEARVLANGSTGVVVRLSGMTSSLGLSSLVAGETLTVDFMYDGAGVDLSSSPLTLTSDNTEVAVTLNALAGATGGTLTAAFDGALVNADVETARLPVAIVPREFALSFVTPQSDASEEARVLANGSTGVAVRLSGMTSLLGLSSLGAGETLTVVLTYTGTGVGLSVSTVAFSANSTEVSVTLTVAFDATDGTLTAALDGALVNADVEMARLTVAIVPREFALSFATPQDEVLESARVLANGSTGVVVRLSGTTSSLGLSSLGAGETLTVALTYTNGTGIGVPPTVVFSTNSTEVSVTLTAAFDATTGMLTAAVVPRDAPLNAVEVESVSLSVDIVPREFALSFTTPEDTLLKTPVRVLSGATTEVRVMLSNAGALRLGESVQVSLSRNVVTTDETGLTLTAAGPSARLIVAAAHDAPRLSGMVVSSGEVRLDGNLIVNTQVLPATLAVVVVARQFHLSVERGSVEIASERVVAGGTAEVVVRVAGVDDPLLGMSQLFAGETLTVDLVYMDGMGVSLSPAPVLLGPGNPGPYLGDTARSLATVVASLEATNGVLELTGGGLANAVVEPASLAIEILPSEFALVFTPAEIGILLGKEETVDLSLTGASLLLGDEEVRVELSLVDTSTVSLVTSSSLLFNASATRHEVVLRVAPNTSPGTTQLLASVEESPANLADADFVDAELSVNAVGDRDFVWVFRSAETNEELPEVVVVAGATTRLAVSLEGVQGVKLLTDEQVDAALTAPVGMMVSPSSLMLNVDMMSREVVLTAEFGAMAGELALDVTRTTPDPLPNATITLRATLPVRVVREFALSFTTLQDEPLDTVRVLAGGSTEVRVTMSNAGTLLDNEVVTVSLTPDAAVLLQSSDISARHFLTLSKQFPRDRVTIGAVHDAATLLGTVMMSSGEVLRLNGATVENTRVLPTITTLVVEIAPRQFRLELGGAGIAYTRSLGVLIPDDTSMQSVRSTIEVEEDITIDSFWVAVVIAHGSPRELIVELVPPDGGVSLRLHNRTGTGDSFYLRRLYTLRDEPELRSLRGTSASGEWELTVGDYVSGFVGTLDTWGIGFGSTPVRVLAGASTVVTMRLVGVDTGLGTPMLSGGETVTVDMFAYGRGVGVTPPAFTFTADSTQTEVTVTASADASAGFLSAAASPGSLPVNAAVESGARAVEIAPRRFRIELDVAGDSYTRSFSPGLVIEDNTGDQSVSSTIEVEEDITIDSLWVAVSITHKLVADLIVELTPPGGVALQLHVLMASNARTNLRRVYTAQEPPLDGLVGTQAQGEWVLTVGDREDEDVGTLDAWGIGFGTQARVMAGAATMVTTRLVGVDTGLGSSRLFPGEAVEFSAFEYASVGVGAAPFSFTQGSTEVDLTLTASADATTGTLFAVAIAPVNTVLEPPFVALAVGIDPREFALVFTPPEIGILVGGEATASLSLAGASLIAGETLMVDLTYTDGTGRRVVRADGGVFRKQPPRLR